MILKENILIGAQVFGQAKNYKPTWTKTMNFFIEVITGSKIQFQKLYFWRNGSFYLTTKNRLSKIDSEVAEVGKLEVVILQLMLYVFTISFGLFLYQENNPLFVSFLLTFPGICFIYFDTFHQHFLDSFSFVIHQIIKLAL